MAMAISISTADPAATTRSFPWPVLEAGNGAFPQGTYTIEIKHEERGRSFTISHRIDRAELIQRWIEEGRAQFACAVAAPVSAYRELHSSSEPSHLVQWSPDDMGSPPLFTPTVVSAGEIQCTLKARRDGVNPLWDGRAVHLPKGARLAVGPTFSLRSGLLGLLDFRLDGSLTPGRFRVEASHEGGFRFNVYLAPDLYHYLAAHRQVNAGWNIMTHIVSASLAKLQSRYSDDNGEEGWESYTNLVSLSDELVRRELPHWADENFDPELVATGLYPHKVGSEEGD